MTRANICTPKRTVEKQQHNRFNCEDKIFKYMYFYFHKGHRTGFRLGFFKTKCENEVILRAIAAF